MSDQQPQPAAESRDAAEARLQPHTAKNTAPFSFAGVRCWARLVGAHDGDTVSVVMEVAPGRFCRLPLRLRGIDTCEMTSADPQLKARAVRARNRALDILTGLKLDDARHYAKKDIDDLLARRCYAVWVEPGDNDKYGRVLADVRSAPGCVTVSEALLQEGLAYAYDGGTKRTEREQAAAAATA